MLLGAQYLSPYGQERTRALWLGNTRKDVLTLMRSRYILFDHSTCYILTFWPGQKCHSKVMHRKEVTHSDGSYERKSRGRKLADEMGRAKKFPWYTHRLMHRKRVTSELHDSYFRLMTIKHSISKIEWASNDYITQLSSTSQLSWWQLSCRQ